MVHHLNKMSIFAAYFTQKLNTNERQRAGDSQYQTGVKIKE